MDMQQVKYYPCTEDDEDAILLVDLETEAVPAVDAEGNRQYYCIAGQHILIVDANGEVVQP